MQILYLFPRDRTTGEMFTANTLVFRKGKGIIMREPSVVAVDTRTDTVRYVGQEAKVRSPISRLYLRLTYWMIAESSASPPMRTERAATMPPSEQCVRSRMA